MEEYLKIIEVLVIAFGIDYYFCSIHTMRHEKLTPIIFYLCFLIFFIISFPFFTNYMIWIIYIALSLFIISHICFKGTLKQRLMSLGILSLIYMLEEMIGTIILFMVYSDAWPILSLSTPLGQGCLMIILFYFGIEKCERIIGYIFIILTLLMLWCDYVIYDGFMKLRAERISHVKLAESEIFTQKQLELRKIRHDLMNHLMVLEDMIDEYSEKEIDNYIEQIEMIYKEDKDDI